METRYRSETVEPLGKNRNCSATHQRRSGCLGSSPVSPPARKTEGVAPPEDLCGDQVSVDGDAVLETVMAVSECMGAG
jgi:hypothetical protein